MHTFWAVFEFATFLATLSLEGENLLRMAFPQFMLIR